MVHKLINMDIKHQALSPKGTSFVLCVALFFIVSCCLLKKINCGGDCMA